MMPAPVPVQQHSGGFLHSVAGALGLPAHVVGAALAPLMPPRQATFHGQVHPTGVGIVYPSAVPWARGFAPNYGAALPRMGTGDNILLNGALGLIPMQDIHRRRKRR